MHEPHGRHRIHGNSCSHHPKWGRPGGDRHQFRSGDSVKDGALTIRDRDVIAMTEAIVARAQGNYASVDDIAADVRAKLGGETVGVLFPILSRNRFAIYLRGIAKRARKVVLMLSYPSSCGVVITSSMWMRWTRWISGMSHLGVTGSCSATPSTPSRAWTM